MNHIKCPRCGLTNWSTDFNCIGCEFLFQPEMPQAIQKPELPLSEFSFADLADPNDFSEILPSHSRTPQMMAKIAATRQTAKDSQNHAQKVSQIYNSQTSPKIDSFYRQPIQSAAVSVKTNNDNILRQVTDDSANQTESKNGLLIAAVILGILGFFAMMFLVGLLVFVNRSLFV